MHTASDTSNMPDSDFEFVAKHEPDEETEGRILMMILNYPESEIQRVLANLRLESGD